MDTFRSVRAVLLEQLFPRFSSFFFQEKQEIFPNLGNLRDGKICGTPIIPSFENNNGKSGNDKKNPRNIIKI